MSEKKKKVPGLRFPGFTEAWEQRKLGEIAKYRNGKAHENDIDENGKYVVVNSKFVSTDGKVQKFSNSQNEPLYENEITFVLSDVPNGRAIARTFFVDKADKYTLNQRIAGITPLENTYPYFLYILMNRNRYFLQFDDGAKQTNLSVDDVMKFEEYYPKKEEQQAIGAFFKQLDNLITLHQRKLTHLQARKKGLLQKMFPKDGELFPELRFPGFTDAWEQRKLDDLVDRIKSYTLSRDVETTENTGVKYVHYGDIHTKVADKITNSSLIPNIKTGNYEPLQKGDLVLADASEDYQGIATPSVILENTTFQIIAGLHTIALRPKNVDSLFLYYLINTAIFRKYGYRIGTGMKVFGISVTNVMKFESVFPSIEEQAKIGAFFKQLDDSITLHQRKLDHLQTRKKALLQQLFV